MSTVGCGSDNGNSKVQEESDEYGSGLPWLAWRKQTQYKEHDGGPNEKVGYECDDPANKEPFINPHQLGLLSRNVRQAFVLPFSYLCYLFWTEQRFVSPKSMLYPERVFNKVVNVQTLPKVSHHLSFYGDWTLKRTYCRDRDSKIVGADGSCEDGP